MSRRKRNNSEAGALRIRLGTELKNQARVLAVRGEWPSMNAYIRHLVARGIGEDIKATPGLFLRLRPQATIFKLKEGEVVTTYTPIAQGLGGERVWVLSVIAAMPASLGGGLAYLADVTAGNVPGGLEGRAVVVRAADVA